MRLLATILLFVFSVSVLAQGNTNKYSINPKIGMSYDVNTKPWKSYGLGVNIFSLKDIYTGSFLRFNEIELFGPSEPRENRNDLSFMLGRYFGSRVFRFECQFGLSLVWGG
ncbi:MULTISPECIES: hypothetical protein [unclassified Lentimicrobium]|uniref:hypothetical protein n=1 Tax=unclassified Lentimicrobium TaxID=2677434 RepID=UPI001552F9F5|nr:MULTISPECIES: hypothetical protein [unclassified Lentimicrobium]NPD44921.1 hypothetical protein [Lentimicrobium sp. S6]NPD85884.1 hypothetical protein [Lentimicrobium sp. L6]